MKIYHPSLLILSVLSISGFVLLAAMLNTNMIETIDTWIIENVQELKNPFNTTVMEFFSFIGNTVSVIVISLIMMGILYTIFGQRKELIMFIIVLAGSTALNLLLKSLFQRERPTLYTMVAEEGFSFPSGHTMAALSLYGILTFLLWRHIPKKSGRVILISISVLFIFAIGFSRIYLGAHYPSDILGAFLFSSFWLFLNVWAFKTWQLRRK